jgi:hypothetical protein
MNLKVYLLHMIHSRSNSSLACLSHASQKNLSSTVFFCGMRQRLLWCALLLTMPINSDYKICRWCAYACMAHDGMRRVHASRHSTIAVQPSGSYRLQSKFVEACTRIMQ